MQFRNHEVVGDILELAERYRDEGADELVFYDITASPDGRSVDRSWINRVAEILDIPFCNGEILYKIRSKTGWEQTLAYEATVTSKKEETPEELDYYQSMLKLQKIGATLQVLSINGKTFSNLKFQEAGDDWTKQIMEVRKACTETIDTMDSTKMTLTLNALRIFEYKTATMAAKCNTSDFWVPAD